MPVTFARAVFYAGALALAGCYSGQGTDSSSTQNAGPVLPAGVFVPADGKTLFTGIYPGGAADDMTCCWLGPDVTFQTKVPAGAKNLLLTVYLPTGFAWLQQRPESAAITVDGSRPARFPRLAPGVRTLNVPLAPQSAERVATVEITPGYAWRPVDHQLNGDTRELTFYLKNVTAR